MSNIWILCVLTVTVLPMYTAFFFGPPPDTDPDDPDASTEPPFGFLSFGNEGMQLNSNPGQDHDSDEDSMMMGENYGCCPTLSKKKRKKNKKQCEEGIEDECAHDFFCGAVQKCCHDGCRHVCMKPKTMCKNNKKWRANLKVKVKGQDVECENCGCVKATNLDFSHPGFLKKLCKVNEEMSKKCCKTCEMNFNLGYKEKCD